MVVTGHLVFPSSPLGMYLDVLCHVSALLSDFVRLHVSIIVLTFDAL